jgi:O-antigen ligase
MKLAIAPPLIHAAGTTRATSRDVAAALGTVGVRCLLLGLAGGIFALSVKYVVLLALAAAAVVFALLACVRRVHPVAILVLLNFGYWVTTGLLSGGMTPGSAASGDFWRGEGRCFFFYLPLLAISVLHLGRRELRFLVHVVYGLTLAGGLLCLLWLAGLGHLFQSEVDPETGLKNEAVYFVGLQTSHTGAGAFWATVTAFLAAYCIHARSTAAGALGALALLLTLASGGRAATLGVLAAVAWMVLAGDLLTPRVVKLAVPLLVPVAAAGWLLVASVPEVNERMAEMFSSETASAVAHVWEEPTLREASGYFHSGANLEHHNLVIRVFLWKYALRLFGQSPLTGIGFGRFNDTSLQFAGIPYVANLAVGGERWLSSGIQWEQDQRMASTGNAHNSYLHMLAETGLLGTALLLCLWWMMFRALRPPAGAAGWHVGYCRGCQAMIICLLITALPGHALGAPSGGILLTTLVGAHLAQR